MWYPLKTVSELVCNAWFNWISQWLCLIGSRYKYLKNEPNLFARFQRFCLYLLISFCSDELLLNTNAAFMQHSSKLHFSKTVMVLCIKFCIKVAWAHFWDLYFKVTARSIDVALWAWRQLCYNLNKTSHQRCIKVHQV